MLKQLLEGRAPGALPLFTEYHLRKALDLMSKAAIGRGMLAKKLGLGEGSARTVVKILKSGELIKTSKKGCELTKKGQALIKELQRHIIKIHEIEAGKLAVGKYAVAVLVRGAGNRVRHGVEQRDAAIMVGAAGATTIVCRGGKLRAPTISEDIEQDYPQLAKKLLSILAPRNNDVIVIGSADEETAAERGAEAAAYALKGEG
jgi:predicted transcriptional regulator